MAKLSDIHLRINNWRIGDYATFEGRLEYGFRAVGQLSKVDRRTNYGTFEGYIIFSTSKTQKKGAKFIWGLYLESSPRKDLQPNEGSRNEYENIVGRLNK